MTTSTLSRPAATSMTIWPAEMARADWRAEAIAEHERTREAAQAARRAELAWRVRELTGRAVAVESVMLPTERRAIAWVDGVNFRLDGHELSIVRPCSHCGVAEVISPPIGGRAELGYAIGPWEPRCPQCPVEDPPGW